MLKKIATILAALALVAVAAAPSMAAKKTTTFYLHGRGPATEAYINETWIDSNYMSMDTTEPANATPSSMFVTNYFRGPNTDCNGNGLLPVWRGEYSAKFKGDIKVTLHTVATPAVKMTVSIYPDMTGTCTSAPPVGDSQAPPPVATSTIDVAPGHGETVVMFKKVKMVAAASLGLQLSIPTQTTPGQVRILFDSSDFASNVQLIPAK
ncbi:MAG TPA: hypothetical protein VFK89_07225 [Actinomycetota bacterium]|nr:hypothetical protein [Actinomycetota bacterium]